jgi:hypothetical protein
LDGLCRAGKFEGDARGDALEFSFEPDQESGHDRKVSGEGGIFHARADVGEGEGPGVHAGAFHGVRGMLEGGNVSLRDRLAHGLEILRDVIAERMKDVREKRRVGFLREIAEALNCLAIERNRERSIGGGIHGAGLGSEWGLMIVRAAPAGWRNAGNGPSEDCRTTWIQKSWLILKHLVTGREAK